MSRSKGFYIDTLEEVNELVQVGAALKLDKDGHRPGPTRHSWRSSTSTSPRTATSPEFVGSFGIDIKDGADDDLAVLDLTGCGDRPHPRVADAIEVSVEARVDIDWHLAATVDAAMPGVSTDFKLTWGWGAQHEEGKTPQQPRPA